MEDQTEALALEKVESQIDTELQSFPFASGYKSGTLLNVLRSAIDYTFIINQLSTFPLRCSEEFKNVKARLSDLISLKMTENQIRIAVEYLNIANHEHFLVNTQLKLIQQKQNWNILAG